MRSLRLSHEQVQTIVEQAKAGKPYEICGLIAGQMAVAQEIFPIPNCAETPQVQYDMDAKALLKAYKQIDSTGQILLAVYHSHPKSDPLPSPTDIREAARNMPNVIQLIVSLKYDTARLQAWHIHDGQVDRAELLVGNEPSRSMEVLSRSQMITIILTTILAFIFLLVISISLLPPAPPIPTP